MMSYRWFRFQCLVFAACFFSLPSIAADSGALGPSDTTSVLQVEMTADDYFTLGKAYRDRFSYGPENWDKAEKFLQAAAERGVAKAYTELGRLYSLYFEHSDQLKAAKCFKKAFEMGDVEAANELGRIAQDEGKYDEAVSLYERAADKNIGEAFINLAKLYFNGFGVKQDFAKSAQLLQKAVDLRESFMAKEPLAYLYAHGLGVQKDTQKAIQLYTEAAEDFREDWVPLGDIIDMA